MQPGLTKENINYEYDANGSSNNITKVVMAVIPLLSITSLPIEISDVAPEVGTDLSTAYR